jgi:hypothetical protein
VSSCIPSHFAGSFAGQTAGSTAAAGVPRLIQTLRCIRHSCRQKLKPLQYSIVTVVYLPRQPRNLTFAMHCALLVELDHGGHMSHAPPTSQMMHQQGQKPLFKLLQARFHESRALEQASKTPACTGVCCYKLKSYSETYTYILHFQAGQGTADSRGVPRSGRKTSVELLPSSLRAVTGPCGA